ncbi:melanoregulin-like [Sinocyclocheilus rhinocerous]|uniref:melanoregulin-like n=1 Tax=Sinocyclocheilus rhinocerous TaxID=307959 RepID=UPI0007B921C3|nr:PREDICTED: melanoregulin-like [Sinocyclocheilus rhinocerous]
MVQLSPVVSSVLQGYRRLSIDIEAMRDMRREVRDKWKMILENLGFMAEAESLLTVSATASYDRMRNAAVARSLLQDPPHRDVHIQQQRVSTREIPLHPGPADLSGRC